jgi:hypothetical protein
MFVDMFLHMPQALVQQLRCHESRDLIASKTGIFKPWCCEKCGKLKHCEGVWLSVHKLASIDIAIRDLL